MTSRKLRTIKIGPIVYFWRVRHLHDRADTRGCVEVFTAFSEEFQKRPARILFPIDDEHGVGWPRRSGVIAVGLDSIRFINLNRPRIARLLIKLAVASGWAPDGSHHEFLIADGYQLLRKNSGQVLAALADSGKSAIRRQKA